MFTQTPLKMDIKIRRQLTLFVHPDNAHEIEKIRHQFNPRQQELIAAHVTLCREDEIENIEAVLNTLRKLEKSIITIRFGHPIRFEDGKGVLLPASGDNTQFHQLRLKVLPGPDMVVRRHEPHITLMHPRNSICTDEVFEAIRKITLPTTLTFHNVSLIQQVDGGQWETLKTV